MDKRLFLSYLFDFYNLLLTDKQRNIFEMYYFNDLSLKEIAEELSITKQAVRDSLLKTENILNDYENKLKLYNKFFMRNKLIDSLLNENDINKIKQELKNLI